MIIKEDIIQFEERGTNEEKVTHQINRFKEGFLPARLSESVSIGSGILRLTSDQLEQAVSTYEKSNVRVIKFVPASGAASRMFKDLFQFLETGDLDETIEKFMAHIKDFAFYGDLANTIQLHHSVPLLSALEKRDYKLILNALLNTPGLAYGQLPKGLLKFHKYDGYVRTPVEEHIQEGIAYANKNDEVNIHFTVSPAHQDLFEKHIQEIKNGFGGEVPEIKVTFSTQKPSTDTIAVDLDNNAFRDDTGNLLFRPAGHGALLANLNELDADIIFIKNIDNVVPDRVKRATTTYKKAIAGVLLNYQFKAFSLLRRLDRGENVYAESLELLKEMGCEGEISEEHIKVLLNRPIRVCGMVKNEGEPGGGPFWVKKGDRRTLQIVESAQVDHGSPLQHEIFQRSTHFNPVDIVCGVKDYQGKKFDLLAYQDEDAGFISEKSFQGRKLKAMELPGLWNGGMADWNTIFVEVPSITFNPVKTVMDLLKENHQ